MVGAVVLLFSPPISPVYIYRGTGDLGCSSLLIYRVDRRNMGLLGQNPPAIHIRIISSPTAGTELKWLMRWYLRDPYFLRRSR